MRQQANRQRSGLETTPLDLARLVAANEALRHANEQLHHDLDDMIAQTRQQVAEGKLLRAIIDQVPDYLFAKDLQSRFLVVNKAVAAAGGNANTADQIGKTDQDFLPQELYRKFRAEELAVMTTGQPMVDLEESSFDLTLNYRAVSTTKVPLRDETGAIIGLVGIARDITERKRGELLRNEQAALLEMIVLDSALPVVLDRLARSVETQIDGAHCAVLLFDPVEQRLLPGAAPNLPEQFMRYFEEWSCPVASDNVLAEPCWPAVAALMAEHGLRQTLISPVHTPNGALLGAIAVYSPTTQDIVGPQRTIIDMMARLFAIAYERKTTEDHIRFMAHHDALTGLPNRTMLEDSIAEAVRRASVAGSTASVVFVDLDNFKSINDSLGHAAGDELLKTMSVRMASCLAPTDTVLRLGGDEFVILLNSGDANALIPALERLRAEMGQPVRLGGQDYLVTASMGAATYPADGCDVETLLTNADAAMYRAKDIGRDNFQFYAPSMNPQGQGRLKDLADLRRGIASKEMVLHYQPQLDLRTGKIFAVEALVRWQHPERGLLAPGQFIPLAEESGLIIHLGDWVLHEACRQNKAWQDAGLPPIAVAINVSARQLQEKNWLERIVHALDTSGLAPQYLELEFTESLIMQDVPQAVALMSVLEAMGVQLSIDDFGTGYSSLAALKRFPVARLKIDRAFVCNLEADEEDRAIARAVIALGQNLNMRVIAEGVETAEQMNFLRDNQCDEMQGYLFSRPIDAGSLADLLGRHMPGLPQA